MMNLLTNGQSHQADVPDDMPLLWVLRDVLGLTGTKLAFRPAQPHWRDNDDVDDCER